ncbi:dephospho-CoA kinase [Microbacterium sp. F51-2R]|jgi:dephospho-CoA kinase|uniref:dephospho-CoA kinase n=1 Tax=Microbacterium sp. F51-2R TaxID=3445777 RepID=UPI003F9ECF10
MPLIALTGGIASGKSTIAGRLAEHGAVIVDADQIVRDVQAAGSPVLHDIAAEFGASMIRPDGTLDRAALGGRVFGDDAAVARLNAIVHPAVRAESARRFEEAFAADPRAVVVYDVPLLVEARVDDPWDLVVVAHAPAEVRQRRLVELRGMTAQDAAARIASQVSDHARLAVADVVIDTSGSIDETLRQTDEVWERLPALVAERTERTERAERAEHAER